MRYTALAIVGAVLITILLLSPRGLRYLHDWFHETSFYYPDIEMMREVRASQAPSFIPASAQDINEKFNSDHNTVVFSFTFNPSDCEALVCFFDVVETREEQLAIYPSWALPERWLPRELRLGRTDRLSARGFTIYESKQSVATKPLYSSMWKKEIWYAAINCSRGEAYAWNKILYLEGEEEWGATATDTTHLNSEGGSIGIRLGKRASC